MASPKDWTVLVAPVRLEIIEAMRMIARCSVADIASALDRPADTLYRHVEQLVEAGAVVEIGPRRRGKRFEKVYDLVADDFRIGFKDGRDRTANKAYNDTLQSILRIASRTARDSSVANQLIGTGDERNIVGKLEHGWLTHREFQEVRDLMMRIKSVMDRCKARGDGRLYLTAFLAIPVTRRRGSARGVNGNGHGNGATPRDDSRDGEHDGVTKKKRAKRTATKAASPAFASSAAKGSDKSSTKKPARADSKPTSRRATN